MSIKLCQFRKIHCDLIIYLHEIGIINTATILSNDNTARSRKEDFNVFIFINSISIHGEQYIFQVSCHCCTWI